MIDSFSLVIKLSTTQKDRKDEEKKITRSIAYKIYSPIFYFGYYKLFITVEFKCIILVCKVIKFLYLTY